MTTSRESGNELMSTLLNASEGVVAHPGKKIILSTNLPSIDKIDPALLRVGRCYDVLEFRPLTREQAMIARASVGLEPVDFSSKDEWVLAEALFSNIDVRQITNRFARKVGI